MYVKVSLKKNKKFITHLLGVIVLPVRFFDRLDVYIIDFLDFD